MQIYVNWNTCLCKTTCDYASLNLQKKKNSASLLFKSRENTNILPVPVWTRLLLAWFVWHVERLFRAMALGEESVFPLLKHGFQLSSEDAAKFISLLCFSSFPC